MGSARRGQRASHRRRRWLAVLTVLAGVMLGLLTQTSVTFPNLMAADEELAGGGQPGEARTEEADLTDLPTAEGTVLSVERGTPEPEDNEDEPREKSGSEASEDPDQPAPPEPASGEPLNVLILGVDRRPSEGAGSGRSDTIMLAQVSPGSGRIELLSVPRDLFVTIEPGVEDRINTAYAYGGVEQTKAVMEGLTGVPIDAHAIIDFRGFEDVIEAVDGVTVDVGSGQFPEKWYMGEGMETLNGRKALFYARYRGTPGGDIDRIERQQKLLAALRAEILQWNTVTKLPTMLKIANDNVDTDLGLGQAFSLGRALILRGGEGDLETVQLKGHPTTLPSGAQVLIPDYEANHAILQDFQE